MCLMGILEFLVNNSGLLWLLVLVLDSFQVILEKSCISRCYANKLEGVFIISIINVLKKNGFLQMLLSFERAMYFFSYKRYTTQLDFEILDPLSTVRRIKKDNLSVARFGDGEFNIVFHQKGTGFQVFNQSLSDDLIEVIKYSQKNKIQLGLPHGYLNSEADKFKVKTFWWAYVAHNYKDIQNFANIAGKSVFLDASFTRVITEMIDKKKVSQVLKNTKKIWTNKDVLIVEGEGTGFGSGNDLLANAKSVSRIIAPAVNAYSKIEEIRTVVKRALAGYGKTNNVVVLFALGPTATVLASNFSTVVQSIDIGHLDLQYEYLQKGFYKRVKVGKYDNEVINGEEYDIHDDKYYSEIIDRII